MNEWMNDWMNEEPERRFNHENEIDESVERDMQTQNTISNNLCFTDVISDPFFFFPFNSVVDVCI